MDGRPLDLRFRGFDLAVEEHPRYTFHYEVPLPPRGRLTIQDTNFAASEGTSRLAVRGRGDVAVRGDDLPPDVDLIPIRPVWQLSDAEERRTKHVEVAFGARPCLGPGGTPARLESPGSRRGAPASPAVRSDRLSRAARPAPRGSRCWDWP